MSRTVTGGVASAIAQPNVGMVQFVEMLFDGDPLRVCSAGYAMDWNGYSWLGTGQLGSIEEVKETESGEVTGLAFTLSGVPSSTLAIALGAAGSYQRRVVNVYTAFLALPTHAILADPVLEWSGLIDTMDIIDEAETATVRVTAENELFDFDRPSPLYWSDEDQQALYPGDTGLRFAKQLTDRALIWPAAAFFAR